MRTPRLALVVLSALLACPLAPAAPAPDSGREAKDKLEALKKRLPGVLDAWMKAHPIEGQDDGGTWTYVIVLRRARLVASAEAKFTFFLRRKYEATLAAPDHILTVCLKYHDGLWTTTSYQCSDPTLVRGGRWESTVKR
jgi:hypothetical protein